MLLGCCCSSLPHAAAPLTQVPSRVPILLPHTHPYSLVLLRCTREQCCCKAARGAVRVLLGCCWVLQGCCRGADGWCAVRALLGGALLGGVLLGGVLLRYC